MNIPNSFQNQIYQKTTSQINIVKDIPIDDYTKLNADRNKILKDLYNVFKYGVNNPNDQKTNIDIYRKYAEDAYDKIKMLDKKLGKKEISLADFLSDIKDHMNGADESAKAIFNGVVNQELDDLLRNIKLLEMAAKDNYDVANEALGKMADYRKMHNLIYDGVGNPTPTTDRAMLGFKSLRKR